MLTKQHDIVATKKQNNKQALYHNFKLQHGSLNS